MAADSSSTVPAPLPAAASTPAAGRGVYGISVAAELVGMAPQALRLYESKGLVEPERTAGGTRRYSAEDVVRLQRIGQLLDAGVNLAGIAMVLELEDANAELHSQLGRSDPPRGLPPTRSAG